MSMSKLLIDDCEIKGPASAINNSSPFPAIFAA